MSAEPKPKPRRTPFHLGPDRAGQLSTYALIRAAYRDRTDQAREILKADPEQIALHDPFAGLTALHIAIFRENEELVWLLTQHPRCDPDAKDNFQRTAADMLIYTANPVIFDLVMRRAYPDEERTWLDDAFEEGRASGTVVPLRPSTER